jgi:hypothetical protein
VNNILFGSAGLLALMITALPSSAADFPIKAPAAEASVSGRMLDWSDSMQAFKADTERRKATGSLRLVTINLIGIRAASSAAHMQE